MTTKRLVDFSGQLVAAEAYRPVWLASLADDVTLEGSAMNGFVRGPEAVRTIVTYIRTLYDRQEFNFAGPTATTASSRIIRPGSGASRSATSS